ncbi:class I SAM-dependent methyltransferase [Novipirellula sp.]|uniref:class I SAM-dependent methyltransferase n=1 Tax=Novipirellula sp. TaxID=2795430 RepID=UPI00356A25F7
MMSSRVLENDGRTIEEIREHYEIEKALANRLRHASAEERATLYSEVYDELFQRVKHHPLVSGKEQNGRARRVASTIPFLRKFLTPESTFLEIGPGDCALTFGVAKLVEQAYAVDVSEEIMTIAGCPENCELVISDGSDIPIKRNSVDVAYSKDLFEHLHPDDAAIHLKNVMEVLTPGGVYICRTPNALSGPHDVSQFFDDDEPTGLHLKEYTTTELARVFKAAGFSRVIPYVWVKGRLIKLPLWPVVAAESVVGCLPRPLCKMITSRLPLKRVLGRVIAIK